MEWFLTRVTTFPLSACVTEADVRTRLMTHSRSTAPNRPLQTPHLLAGDRVRLIPDQWRWASIFGHARAEDSRSSRALPPPEAAGFVCWRLFRAAVAQQLRHTADAFMSAAVSRSLASLDHQVSASWLFQPPQKDFHVQTGAQAASMLDCILIVLCNDPWRNGLLQ